MTVEMALPERFHAEGDYAREDSGVAELCEFIEASGTFRVYREVPGILIFRSPIREEKTVRVDLILSPQQTALDAGWNQGQLGVECKRSGEKLAPAVAQARDYQASKFFLRNQRDSRSGVLRAVVAPLWFFIYPFDPPGGDVESLMAADGIGALNWRREQPSGEWYLRFKVGSYKMLEVYHDGRMWVNRDPVPGRKVGCR